MARPQLENGHTKIANELVEAFARVNFSAYESRILWAIFRKTYGWGKKTDRISYSQFEETTGIDRRHIGRAVLSLKARGIITCEGSGYALQYGIQKDYERWDLTPIEAPKIDTDSGNELTPKEAMNSTGDLTPIQGDLTPIQGELLPKQVSKSLPKEATTKAIKHLQKNTTKESVKLPEWINRKNWDDFIEMRKRIKAPPTEQAIVKLINKLSELRDAGNEPNRVLDESTMNNWKGVFALKDGRNDNKVNQGNTRRNPSTYTDAESIYHDRDTGSE